MDWQTYSSEIGGFTAATHAGLPLHLAAVDVHRHGSAQARPPQAAVPARLHAEADRRARGADPRDHVPNVLDGLEGRETVRAGQRRRAAGRRARHRQLHGPAARGRRGLGAADELARRRRAGRRGHRHHRVRPQGDGGGHPRDVPPLQPSHRGAAQEPDRRPDQRPRPRRDRRPRPRGPRDRHGLRAADGGRQRLDEGDLHGRDARSARGRRRSATCSSPTRR